MPRLLPAPLVSQPPPVPLALVFPELYVRGVKRVPACGRGGGDGGVFRE